MAQCEGSWGGDPKSCRVKEETTACKSSNPISEFVFYILNGLMLIIIMIVVLQ